MKKEITFVILYSLLIFAAGNLVGYFIKTENQNSENSISSIDDTQIPLPTLQLRGISQGNLEGKVTGGILRIASSATKIKNYYSEDTIKIPLSEINLKTYFSGESLKAEDEFIASKSGEAYYSIYDKRAYAIKPENRITFKTEDAAQNAGYRKAK